MNPTVDIPGCEVISNSVTEVYMDGIAFSEAANFDPPYEAICTQPCIDIRFSTTVPRTVTFKVISLITGGGILTSD